MIDDVTTESLTPVVDMSISGRRVAREPAALLERRGKPAVIVPDNGTGDTSNAILERAKKMQVRWHQVAPGNPNLNGDCEAFNDRMRNERLSETLFFGVDHARQAATHWTDTCNIERPHSAPGIRHRRSLPPNSPQWAISFVHIAEIERDILNAATDYTATPSQKLRCSATRR